MIDEQELNERMEDLFSEYGVQAKYTSLKKNILTIGFIEVADIDYDYNERMEVGFDFLYALSKVLGTREINLGVSSSFNSGYRYSSYTYEDPSGEFAFSLTARLPKDAG